MACDQILWANISFKGMCAVVVYINMNIKKHEYLCDDRPARGVIINGNATKIR